MPKLLLSAPVDGPGDRRVRVLFYDDGSIRLRVSNAAPMRMSEAFLSGRDANVIIKLDPEVPWQMEGGVDTPLDQAQQHEEIVALLREHDEIGVVHRIKRVAESLRQETMSFTLARLEDPSFRAINASSRADQLAPIWKPTIEVLGPRMRQYTAAVLTLMEYAPERVTDAVLPLVRVFEKTVPQGPRLTTDLPRLVGAIVGSTLLGYAIALQRYDAFAAVARCRFKSYKGARPWVFTPEFAHPESLAHDASVFGHVVLEYIKGEDMADLGISSDELNDAAIAANVLVGVLGRGADSDTYAWGVEYYEHRIEPAIRDIASEPAARTHLASVIGEDGDRFSTAFADRYARLFRGSSSMDTHRLDASVLRLFDPGATR